jgi:hypothetical protein
MPSHQAYQEALIALNKERRRVSSTVSKPRAQQIEKKDVQHPTDVTSKRPVPNSVSLSVVPPKELPITLDAFRELHRNMLQLRDKFVGLPDPTDEESKRHRDQLISEHEKLRKRRNDLMREGDKKTNPFLAIYRSELMHGPRADEESFEKILKAWKLQRTQEQQTKKEERVEISTTQAKEVEIIQVSRTNPTVLTERSVEEDISVHRPLGISKPIAQLERQESFVPEQETSTTRSQPAEKPEPVAVVPEVESRDTRASRETTSIIIQKPVEEKKEEVEVRATRHRSVEEQKPTVQEVGTPEKTINLPAFFRKIQSAMDSARETIELFTPINDMEPKKTTEERQKLIDIYEMLRKKRNELMNEGGKENNPLYKLYRDELAGDMNKRKEGRIAFEVLRKANLRLLEAQKRREENTHQR